jgi:hypothetical protein
MDRTRLETAEAHFSISGMLSRVLKGHKDALPDYIRAMRMQSGVVQVDPFNLPACTFHGHGKNEPCPLASKKRKREEND